MTALSWGKPGSKLFEAGVDRGVLYPSSGPGVAWNGLKSVKDTSTESGKSDFYMDGQKYRTTVQNDQFTATIEAFTYPDEFKVYDGLGDALLTQQTRSAFGFSYRTKVGNDTEGLKHGYKIHLVYNAFATPTESDYITLDADPDATTFSWDITTTPVAVPGFAPTAHVIIESNKAYPSALASIESILYGTSSSAPTLPSLSTLLADFLSTSFVIITDNGDGTWTATGPPEVITMLDPQNFQINWVTAVFIDANNYTISS
jgi:hypothetical protein